MKTLNPVLIALFGAALATASFPAAELAASGPLTPEQSLAAFKVEPGLRVEIVAAEPLVVAPVAIAFDERGRLFVTEGHGYPDEAGPGKPSPGRVALLEDPDGDGRYDKRSEFAQGLQFPCGVMPWRGGVFVACSPDVLYLKDTDGDGRADVKRTVLTGFDVAQRSSQHYVNSPALGLDNRIYLADGVGGASKVSSPQHPQRPAVESSGHDWRFHPDTLEVQPVSGYGQFGLTFDDAGHRFVCYNRNPIRHVVLPERYLQRNPRLAFSDTMQEVAKFGQDAKVFPLSPDTTAAGYIPKLLNKPHAGTMTSSCGTHIHRSLALSPEHDGNAFICEPAQNLVQRQVLSPAGGTFTARLAHERADFLASPDVWFRPVSVTTGPDGALYVCDMYRQVIDHPLIFPEEVRATLNFDAGKDLGRIYRVTAKPRKSDLGNAGTKELCAALGDPNGWARDTARRLLLERADPASIPMLRGIVKSGASGRSRLLALGTLDGLGALDDDSLRSALGDAHAPSRENAIRLIEPRLAKTPAFAERLFALASDPDSHVRFQCALTLGEIDEAHIVPALAKIAALAPEDRWTRAAVFSSLGTRSAEFLPAFLAVAPKNHNSMPEAMSDLGRLLGASLPAENCSALLNELTAGTDRSEIAWQPGALTGLAEGLRSRGLATGGRSALVNLVAGNSLARQRLDVVIERSMKLVQDASQPPGARLAALKLLGQSSYSTAGGALLELISAPHPAEVQLAAVRALGELDDPAAAKALVAHERWLSYAPAVREQVVATLVSQPRMLTVLLDALAGGDIAPTMIDAVRRAQLLKHRDESVRQRAEELFQRVSDGDRQKVYDEYKSILALEPDAKSGHAVFQKSCAQCHTYAGKGAAVGPDLTGVRNQPPEALLLHLLVPSLEIQKGFESSQIVTRDGRALVGSIASGTEASVTLRRPLAEPETILRSNIESIFVSSLSLMPDGLEKTVTKQELRDLIGFLKEGDAGK